MRRIILMKVLININYVRLILYFMKQFISFLKRIYNKYYNFIRNNHYLLYSFHFKLQLFSKFYYD